MGGQVEVTANCLFGSCIFGPRGTVPKEQYLGNLTQEASSVPDLDYDVPNYEL